MRIIKNLKEDYHNDRIVPLVGAGLSVPFGIPGWGDIIKELADTFADDFIKKLVDIDLSNSDYWKAVDNLKEYAYVGEQDIQETVAKLIHKRTNTLEDDFLHNYSDLAKMKFKFYLTTNYENLLNKYLNNSIQPICLSDIQFNTQDLFNENRVCQLHGTSSNAGTIVLSRESYKKLYSNKKYDDLLKLVTGTKKILFLGFSFDDQFIKTLIEEHKESFRGEHYIILDNPSPEKVKELKEKYRLNTITYNSGNSSHVEEIRDILQKISEPEVLENLDQDFTDKEATVAIGAGLSSFSKDVKTNLFYKKLELENINPVLIDLSSNFYIAADQYVRGMKKLGMPVDVIDIILGQVFLEYKERYADTYDKYGNSEEFLKVVHESLEGIDYGRYKELLRNSITNKFENKGFIHMLADDEGKEIWWGKERINEGSE